VFQAELQLCLCKLSLGRLYARLLLSLTRSYVRRLGCPEGSYCCADDTTEKTRQSCIHAVTAWYAGRRGGP
jgi:hypothetical protein